MQIYNQNSNSNYKPNFGLKVDKRIIEEGERGLKALENPQVIDKFIDTVPDIFKSTKKPLLDAKDKLSYIKAKYYNTLSFLQEYKNKSDVEVVFSKSHDGDIIIKRVTDYTGPSIGISKYSGAPIYNEETNVVRAFFDLYKKNVKDIVKHLSNNATGI